MDPLASANDVALALGLEDADALSEAQGLRVDGLLARVSREFRREAERTFTPGTSTVRLVTAAGRVHLAETVGSVTSVTVDGCYGDPVALDFEVQGQSVVLEQYGRPLPSGVTVTVVYTHTAEVPDDVTAAVAGIVARHLTLDPNLGPVTEMSAGPFRQRYADWANKTGLLTEEDCEVARSYRYPGTNVIIQRP